MKVTNMRTNLAHGMRAALRGKEKFFPMNRKGVERGFIFALEGE